MTIEGNTDKAKAELVRVLTLAPGVSEQKARADIELLIDMIDDEGAFCELVSSLINGKSEKELREHAQQIAEVVSMAGGEAARRRVANLRTVIEFLINIVEDAGTDSKQEAIDSRRALKKMDDPEESEGVANEGPAAQDDPDGRRG